ncbi:hypothetical protein, partial [Tritonibacter sp. SIMBA_163]|uniref:hypothetical protein n=1 Tax=Tritonibacter sp. SIMBA_163 TaxID=3080868 RepID=UPI00397F0A33
MEIGYATLISDISRRSSDSFATAVDLARQDGMTERLLPRNGELEDEVGALRGRVDTLLTSRASLQEELSGLRDQFDAVSEERDLAFVEND